MNIEKLIQAVGYILNKYKGILNYTKLIKILYLADRKSMQETGYSITGDSYVSMKDGPVLSSLYSLIKNNFKNKAIQYYWNSKFQTDDYDIHLLVPFLSKGKLTSSETEILDSIDKQFHNDSYSQMISFVHNPNNCPEWKNTQSSIPLLETEILKNIGFSDNDIKVIEDEKKFYEAEEKLIDSIPDIILENTNA